MTLDEAIRHAEEIAGKSCDGCADKFKRLAALMKRLKELKEKGNSNGNE